MSDALLAAALSAAVPMWIDLMRALPDDERLAVARECGQLVAEHGDDVLYRSRREGDTAKAFNALAQGLAALAFAPGGVTFAGMHWCTDHAACEAARC